MKVRSVHTLTIFLILITGAFVFVCWERIKTNFWQVSIGNLLTMVTTLYVTSIVAETVSKGLSFATKKRELLVETLEQLQILLQTIYVDGIKYMGQSRKITQEKKILANFKRVSQLMNQFRDLTKGHSINFANVRYEQLTEKVHKLKSTLTEKHFRTNESKYEDVTKETFNENHGACIAEIHLCKMELFK